MTKITLTWHGHSCFSIANEKHSIVIDPYKAEMIGYPPLAIKAHAMLASHQHEDHNYREAVEFLEAPSELLTEVELDQPWPENLDPELFYFKKISSCHDDVDGKKRGSNIIHLINAGGLKIAHFGDLGHYLNAKQKLYLADLDLALLPVGGYFTIDAAEACDIINQIKPRSIVPMHFIGQYGSLPISGVAPFVELIRNNYQIEKVPGASLTDINIKSKKCYLFSKMKLQPDDPAQ